MHATYKSSLFLLIKTKKMHFKLSIAVIHHSLCLHLTHTRNLGPPQVILEQLSRAPSATNDSNASFLYVSYHNTVPQTQTVNEKNKFAISYPMISYFNKNAYFIYIQYIPVMHTFYILLLFKQTYYIYCFMYTIYTGIHVVYAPAPLRSYSMCVVRVESY